MLKNIVKERLVVGQVIPSYKKLCEILGEKPQAGNSKKSQIKLWESCFSLENGGGNKLVVSEIHEDVKPIKDERDGNGGEFMKYTLPLMLKFLSENNGDITITRTQLMKKLCFFNDSWGKDRYEGWGQDKTLEKYKDDGMIIGNIWDLYDAAGASFNRTLEEVINYMGRGNWDRKSKKYEGMELIDLDTRYVFSRKVLVLKSEAKSSNAYEIERSYWFSIPDNERELYTEKVVRQDATREEMKRIRSISRELMTNDNKESHKEITGKQANFKFQREFEEAICQEFNCDYYFEKYHITYIKSEVDALLEMRNYEELAMEFNETMALNQSMNSQKRRISAIAMINSDTYKHLLSIAKMPEFIIDDMLNGDNLTDMEKKLLARISPQFTSITDKIINDRMLINGGKIEDIRDKHGIIFIDENYNLLDESDIDIADLLDYQLDMA